MKSHIVRIARRAAAGAARLAKGYGLLLVVAMTTITGSMFVLATRLVEEEIMSTLFLHGDSLRPEVTADHHLDTPSAYTAVSLEPGTNAVSISSGANPEVSPVSIDVIPLARKDIESRVKMSESANLGGFRLSGDASGPALTPPTSAQGGH